MSRLTYWWKSNVLIFKHRATQRALIKASNEGDWQRSNVLRDRLCELLAETRALEEESGIK